MKAHFHPNGWKSASLGTTSLKKWRKKIFKPESKWKVFSKKSGISEPKYLESIKIKDYDLMNRKVNLLGHKNRNMQEKVYDRN
jgi:hypothetical protein